MVDYYTQLAAFLKRYFTDTEIMEESEEVHLAISFFNDLYQEELDELLRFTSTFAVSQPIQLKRDN